MRHRFFAFAAGQLVLDLVSRVPHKRERAEHYLRALLDDGCFLNRDWADRNISPSIHAGGFDRFDFIDDVHTFDDFPKYCVAPSATIF